MCKLFAKITLFTKQKKQIEVKYNLKSIYIKQNRHQPNKELKPSAQRMRRLENDFILVIRLVSEFHSLPLHHRIAFYAK